MCEFAIENKGLSDHFLIMFNVSRSGPALGPESVGSYARTINDLSASKFSGVYNFQSQTQVFEYSPCS